MVERLRQSVEQLEPPGCPHCHIEMKWHQSILVEPQTSTVVHFFHCPNCSRVVETKSVIRTINEATDPKKLSMPHRYPPMTMSDGAAFFCGA